MKQRGFTLVEALIGLAVIAIIVLAIMGGINAANQPDAVCRAGYTFVVVDRQDNELQQLLDANGKGVPCEVK